MVCLHPKCCGDPLSFRRVISDEGCEKFPQASSQGSSVDVRWGDVTKAKDVPFK